MTNSVAKWGIAVAILTMLGCEKDNSSNNTPRPPLSNIIKSGQITADETWDSTSVIQLDGRVVVTNGATLTIKPGTIIKSSAGQEANATNLIITRGSKIMAEGTPNAPIIFTSIADAIQPGEIVSSNLNSTYSGLWGGLLILGKAPISAQGDVTSTQIEGIPPSDTSGLYGGNDSLDNSGVLKYVSIRHGGALIGAGNEINGLTLGGVGSGTTIENIEVVANFDDGIEFFGGNVNCTNLLVWHQGDDAFDIDQSYSGTINNIAYFANDASDHALEIDGPEGSMEGSFTLTNGTFIGDSTFSGEYADFRDGAMGTLTNLCFKDFSSDADVEIDDNTTSDNYKNGKLVFNYPWEFRSTQTFKDIFKDNSDNGDAFQDSSFVFFTKTTSTGANMGPFVGWTWGSIVFSF
jgi:hypothetical protein